MNKTVNSFQSVTFTCNATSAPQPSIQWYKDDIVLNDTDKNRFKVMNTLTGSCVVTDPYFTCSVVSVLVIVNVSTNDGGEYKCYAGSVAGNATKAAYLTVNGMYIGRYKYIFR